MIRACSSGEDPYSRNILARASLHDLEGCGSGRAWNAVKRRSYIEEEDERAMLPMVGVPETLRRGLRPYRDLFGRTEGFEHLSRYVTGLIVSPNKTLQGIYANQVWEGDKPSRRAMHE